MAAVSRQEQGSASQTSRIRGYNHNFSYRGTMFHIQTEDYGQPRCYVCSHIFVAGRVLESVRTDYPDTDPHEITKEQIKGLMLAAHRSLFRRLKEGKYDEYLKETVASNGPPMSHPDVVESAPPGLEDTASPQLEDTASPQLEDTASPQLEDTAALENEIEKFCEQTAKSETKPKASVASEAQSPSVPPPTPAIPVTPQPGPVSGGAQVRGPFKLGGGTSNSVKGPFKLNATSNSTAQPSTKASSPPIATLKPAPEPATAPAASSSTTQAELSGAAQSCLVNLQRELKGLVGMIYFDLPSLSVLFLQEGELKMRDQTAAIGAFANALASNCAKLGGNEHIHEAVTQTDKHFHVLIEVNTTSILYLVIDRRRGNLAMARHKFAPQVKKLRAQSAG